VDISLYEDLLEADLRCGRDAQCTSSRASERLADVADGAKFTHSSLHQDSPPASTHVLRLLTIQRTPEKEHSALSPKQIAK
jgi:hypothetical protein